MDCFPDILASNAVDTGPEDIIAAPAQKTPARIFDQFYTRREVAERCMADVKRELARQGEDMEAHRGLWIEPSAGMGAFLSLMPEGRRIGVDLDPPEGAMPEIVKADFRHWEAPEGYARPAIIVGNPPFGRNGSLALQFLRRSAGIAKYVCFILPRTFQKTSMQDKVVSVLDLVYDRQLEDDAFTHVDRLYDVPCCFQIWRVQDSHRQRQLRSLRHDDFEIVASEKDAEFAFQRVGAQAGTVSDEGLAKSWKSHYFIRTRTDEVDVRRVLEGICWKDVRAKTAGNPSIGKADLVEAYVQATGRPAPEPTSRAAAANAGNLAFDFGGTGTLST